MSLGDVHIMMFYRRLEKVSLTHSIKFVTITFLKYSFSLQPIEFVQCLKILERRPKDVLIAS